MNSAGKKNFKLVIEYDGTNYHGWQIQPSDSSIQNEIQKVLCTITQSDIFIVGSGRTDAGVHANGQVANFTCNTKITAEKFQDALNKMLPDDIVIKNCSIVNPDFHARFSAKIKNYQYQILNTRIPVAVNRHYYWHIIKKLDIESMQQAANFLVGEKDFKSFEGSGSPRKTTVRTIYKAEFSKENNILLFNISGNGFLKFMVRNIIGTLVDVGYGKITPKEFNGIIEAKDRAFASPTAPAHGLFLKKVEY